MAVGELHLQLSVDFPDSPKVRALCRHGKDVRAIRDLYVQMSLYCKRTLSDGFVPEEQIGLLVYPDTPKNGLRDAQRLVDADLIEVAEGGYFVPGFLKRNKSKAQVHQDAEKKAAGGSRGNHERWHVKKGVVKPHCPYCQEGDSDPDRTSDRTSDSQSDRTSDQSNDPKRSPETETETETETEIQDPADPAPPPADADGEVLRLAANGQPPARRTSRKQHTPNGPNAGAVVKAYVDGAKAGGQPRPAETLRQRVGKQAGPLLADEHITPEQVLTAAYNMGAAGWADLAVQLQRDAANAKPGGANNGNGRAPGATPSQYSEEDYLNASFKR